MKNQQKKSKKKKVYSENQSALKILFLAPQPFYQERGSPIANDMILQLLSDRGEEVNVVTYSEGCDIYYDHVNVYRIRKLPYIKNIKPGFSGKKIICDFLMFLKVIRLVLKTRYHLVHAVEESVFIALFIKICLRIPYLYDMDSSLPEQMIEKYPRLVPISFCFDWFEKIAVNNALVVVPVCQAIANRVARYQPRQIELIPDVSLLKSKSNEQPEKLRQLLNIDGIILMYVGNLERYQGIGLLLESMVLVLQQTDIANLIVIGGDSDDIIAYRQQAKQLGIEDRVYFLGPRPTNLIAEYLGQADILVSPRIKGKNTPMKIYSYLDSGKAVVATDLPTHTQVMDRRVAVLAKPNPDEFAHGLLCLIKDPELRSRLGAAGKKMVKENYTPAVFRHKFNSLYDSLKDQLFNSRNGQIAQS